MTAESALVQTSGGFCLPRPPAAAALWAAWRGPPSAHSEAVLGAAMASFQTASQLRSYSSRGSGP